MKWMTVLGLLLIASGAVAQDRKFDPKNEFGVFTEYANTSSHILIGQEENRKLLIAGASYARRLKSNRVASWRWQVDVQPLVELRNPVLTTDETVVYTGPPVSTFTGIPPGAYHFVILTNRECASASGSGVYYGSDATGQSIPVETYTYASTCNDEWTYGGGLSPLGQTINFLPRKRVQPFFAANAGFLAFDKVTPSNNATQFNFSFEVAMGVQYFVRAGRAVTVDYRYHHVSNAYRGVENPGVDSGLVRVAYNFGR